MKTKFSLIIVLLLIMENTNAQQVFGRFECKGQISYGEVIGNSILSLDKAPWFGGKRIGKAIALSEVKILHPSEPKVIIGLGSSYKNSWVDKEPFKAVRWFMKPPSSAASPNDTIIIPAALDALKVEVELTIIIGKTLKDATETEAINAIFGYTIGNDIVGSSDSFHQNQGEPFDQNDPLLGPGLKIGDKFAPFGPFIYTNFDYLNKSRTMTITSSGIEKINTIDNTNNLIYTPEKIVSDLSKILTLSPGDVILTGTDKSYLVHDGDKVTISIDGLGTLENNIKK